MPIYLCQSGQNQPEPWRHGIDVYTEIFDIDGKGDESPAILDDGRDQPATSNRRSLFTSETRETMEDDREEGQVDNSHLDQQTEGLARTQRSQSFDPSPPEGSSHAPAIHYGRPFRRVRHAEVVLVDDVCFKFGRYWLRTRMPGASGGFAGYVALPAGNDMLPTAGRSAGVPASSLRPPLGSSQQDTNGMNESLSNVAVVGKS